MLQIITEALGDSSDTTRLTFVYANEAIEDILLKKELDDLAAAHSDRLKIHYVLAKPPANWTNGSHGYINEATIARFMPVPGAGKVFICGPPGMMEALSGGKAPDFSQGELKGTLLALGYKPADVFKF